MQHIDSLRTFLETSPTAFHAVENIAKVLEQAQFQRLIESEPWHIKTGGQYFVTRNHSSIIAVKVGTQLDRYGFTIAASHSDSPTFKIKEQAEIEVAGNYTQLNTEGYGGMLCATWFDKPLSVAGRVLVKHDTRYETKLFAVGRDLVLIPSLAIHMNRTANDGMAYNKQIDMLPLFGGADTKKGMLKKLIAEELGIDPYAIYGSDLYLYNRMKTAVWGAHNEFFSGPRIDNLECAYASLQGFLAGQQANTIQVFACFDNEEVGSGTKQGAASTFLADVLSRVNFALQKTSEDLHCALARSFMLSCDNAHAVHPNHPAKTDAANCAYMNGGIVIKSHAGQKYTSDGVSIALFKGICEKAGVPYQYFANRSDVLGGSTLGNIAMSQVSMNAVDIGLPQLAMHSSYETAGVQDCEYLIKACTVFFNSALAEYDAFNIALQ